MKMTRKQTVGENLLYIMVWAGIILVVISLLFLLLVRPARHTGDRA